MTPPEGRPPLPLWVGGLFLLTVVAVLLAVGLGIEGLWRARAERIEAEEWPAVTATVDGCFLDRDYPFQKNGGGVIYSVECRFRYSVQGMEYVASTRTPGQLHSLRNPSQLPPDALRMEAWARQHRSGSRQVVHYDAANPARISLAGADDALRSNTSGIAFESALSAALLGAGLWLAALAARRFTQGQKRLTDGRGTVRSRDSE